MGEWEKKVEIGKRRIKERGDRRKGLGFHG